MDPATHKRPTAALSHAADLDFPTAQDTFVGSFESLRMLSLNSDLPNLRFLNPDILIFSFVKDL